MSETMSPQESIPPTQPIAARYELPTWAHFVWLIYLGFLFSPLLYPGHSRTWLWPTVLSLPVFVTLYAMVLLKFRRSPPPVAAAFPEILTMAVMGFMLAPLNESANTYVIYSIALASFGISGARRLALFVAAVLAVYAVELSWLRFDPVQFGITAVVSMASGAGNYMMLQNRIRNLELRKSAEKIHRLARLAERERISRDLHDLLGHTLSLIAIKSELAAKLMDRDRVAAGREVTEVMNIAREALRQVRTAVTGIRSAALEGEIASARALLETAGVMFTYERDGTVLSLEVETTLAMIVREAVTNIQRHAGARYASIQVLLDEGGERAVLLKVADDGCGGITTQGNGLAGIRERVEGLGGTLEIESPQGKGTLLRVRVPMVGPVVAGAPETGSADVGVREMARPAVGGDAAGVREAARPVLGVDAAGVREMARPVVGADAAGAGELVEPAGGVSGGVRS